MKNLKLILAALAFATLALPAAHADTLNEDVTSMLSAMKGVYSAYYAPAAWKKQYAGYDLNTEYAKALGELSQKTPLTMADTRVIFRDFIYAMKDYHTSISFTSTEAATLPIVARGAEGKVYLVSIDRTKLSEASFPFSLGDEVISIDGTAVNDVIQKLQDAFALNVEGTDRATAEMRLFARRASRGFAMIPKGPVTLGLRRQGETSVSFIQLIWDYTPEKIAPRQNFFNLRRPVASGSLLRPDMTINTSDLDAAAPNAGKFDLGSRVSFMPALGQKIWENAKDSTFDAYVYMNEDRKLVGYVRIPSYTPADTTKAIAEFQAIVAKMQSITDSLVIDQVNNPGGSVFYLYTLASMLTDQPLATPRHRMAIAQSDVLEALTLIDALKGVTSEDDIAQNPALADFGGYPASLQLINFERSYAQFIVDEWNAGRKLTTPYWIAGVDHINPNPVRYTKPILVLINELDFSGGDFFPTIMQDNKRVTVMGTRTAGAGGYVNDVTVPNNVGVASFRVTMSIAERASGNPIENLGVTPDVEYKMTAADYTMNFAPYVKAVKAALKQITP